MEKRKLFHPLSFRALFACAKICIKLDHRFHLFLGISGYRFVDTCTGGATPGGIWKDLPKHTQTRQRT